YLVTRTSGLSLLTQTYLDLSIDASAPEVSPATADIRGFDLAIPARTSLAAKVQDPRLTIVLALVLAWFVGFLLSNFAAGCGSYARRRLSAATSRSRFAV